MDAEVVFEWLFLLDDLDYYELLGVPPTATYDDIKRAFHAFAETFHPDLHLARSEEEQDAIDAIFKRGAEAYAVLTHPKLRPAYDAQCAAPADGPRSSRRLASVAPPPPPPRPSSRPAGTPVPHLSEQAKTVSGRPHARRAEELLEEGEVALAREQLALAAKMEPDNDLLQAYLRHLDAELKKG